MKNLDQKGIAHLGLMLVIVLVVGAAGFGGWRVYQANQKKDTTTNTQTPSNSEEQTEAEPEQTIPDGFTEYKHETLGFSFAYPAAWGTASTEKSSNAEKGQLHFIKFSKNSLVTAELMSSDFQDATPSDRPTPAFRDYESLVKDIKANNQQRLDGSKSYSAVVLSDTANYIVFTDFDCLGSGYYIQAITPFSGKAVTGIGFLYQDVKIIQGACDQTGESVTKYVDKTVQEQLVQVIKSVKQL